MGSKERGMEVGREDTLKTSRWEPPILTWLGRGGGRSLAGEDGGG